MKKKKDMKKPLLAAVLACSMVQIPAIPVAAAAPENLALNQTVTASSYEQPTNNPEKTSPSKAVDGDLTTRWGTAQNLAANEWIDLCIPHIEMHKRSFVLKPLEEIAPYKRHPVTGKTVREMLGELENAGQETADA